MTNLTGLRDSGFMTDFHTWQQNISLLCLANSGLSGVKTSVICKFYQGPMKLGFLDCIPSLSTNSPWACAPIEWGQTSRYALQEWRKWCLIEKCLCCEVLRWRM